jgi:accessory gene regulator protein AgrB
VVVLIAANIIWFKISNELAAYESGFKEVFPNEKVYKQKKIKAIICWLVVLALSLFILITVFPTIGRFIQSIGGKK